MTQSIEKRIAAIERGYESKFEAMRTKFRRARESEEQATNLLKRRYEKELSVLRLKVKDHEVRQGNHDKAKARLSDQAKKGYMDLYEDLTSKSKKIAEHFKQAKADLTEKLTKAEADISWHKEALQSVKQELQERARSAEKRAEAAEEKTAAVERQIQTAVEAEAAKHKAAQEAYEQQMQAQTKEVMDLLRSDNKDMRVQNETLRHKCSLLEV